ncbi:MAG: ABC-F family ATP-binding cassette domain-containing protein [Alphaproteobacteria bacterium]|nr:ABC-F family ATP-binding cassette domain-containing protein [Alphaproteobacteria bacterium]
MLRIQDISFSIEGRPLFEGASAVIPTGHKVGFVGRNGTGKTTLFRLITSELSLEGGAISSTKGARIGGVAQEAPASDLSLLETVLEADTERVELLAEAETATDGTRIAEIHGRLQDIDAWSAESRAAMILSGLGFDEAAQARPCADFSGGWRMRVALAGVLFAEPEILLLDEPTNYLDLEGTIWLETYLAKYPHTVLVISHDRELLNRSVNAILHLENRKLTLWTGGYDQFDRGRREKLEQATAAKRKQDARRDHMQAYVDRFRYQASKAKQAQSRLKMIERMVPIALEEEQRIVAFNFPSPEELSPPIVKLDDAVVGYDGKAVLQGLNLRIDQDDRIALLGANGEGKSTLSKLLAGKLKPMEGRIHTSSKLRIGYFAQHQVDELELDETPLQHLRALRPLETPGRLRSRLASGGLGAEQAETVVRKLSGGQKSRLSLLLATLDAPHILILDEPTNHLDIQSREALVTALNDYQGAIILVSHDPHLVSLTADRLWLVKDGKVTIFRDDMDAYRRLLLSERGGVKASQPVEKKVKPAKPSTGKRRQSAPLQSEVFKCEQRVSKLEAMRKELDQRLAAPTVYEARNLKKLEALQKKHHELQDALARAEAMWLTAVEKLDQAKGA